MLHVARYSKTKNKKKEKWWSNTLHKFLLNWRVNPLLTVFDTSFSSSSSCNGDHSRTFSGSASWANAVIHRIWLRLEGLVGPSNSSPARAGTPRVGCPGSRPGEILQGAFKESSKENSKILWDSSGYKQLSSVCPESTFTNVTSFQTISHVEENPLLLCTMFCCRRKILAKQWICHVVCD